MYPTDPKPPVSTRPKQIDVALLRDFSAWVRKAALFCKFHYAAGKIHPEKTGVSWYGMIFQCIVTIIFV